MPQPMPTTAWPAVLLLGAGGHGRVVADAARRRQLRLCVTDADPARVRTELLPGVPCCAPDQAQDWLRAHGAGLHVAIGHNATREREALAWAARLGTGGLASIAHPDASVSTDAVLAPACFVAARAVLGPSARLGLGCIVNHGAVVDHEVQVGDFCHVAPLAALGGAVRLGARVLVGAGAVVLPGLSLCDDVVLGAGAVATASITEPGVYVGVPARRVS